MRVLCFVFMFFVGSVHSNGLPSIFTHVNTPEGGSFIYGSPDSKITNEFWRMCNASLYTQAMEEFADLDLGTASRAAALGTAMAPLQRVQCPMVHDNSMGAELLYVDCVFVRLFSTNHMTRTGAIAPKIKSLAANRALPVQLTRSNFNLV